MLYSMEVNEDIVYQHMNACNYNLLSSVSSTSASSLSVNIRQHKTMKMISTTIALNLAVYQWSRRSLLYCNQELMRTVKL